MRLPDDPELTQTQLEGIKEQFILTKLLESEKSGYYHYVVWNMTDVTLKELAENKTIEEGEIIQMLFGVEYKQSICKIRNREAIEKKLEDGN